MYMNFDLSVPVTWKLSMSQENTASGFSGSSWLHPLQLLPNDGIRGTDTVWEVRLAEGRKDGGLTTSSFSTTRNGSFMC